MLFYIVLHCSFYVFGTVCHNVLGIDNVPYIYSIVLPQKGATTACFIQKESSDG